MDETPIAAARLGPGGSPTALLRCGSGIIPAGAQRSFLTPQYACVWVVSGSGLYRDAAGRSWPLEPGCVFQRFPGDVHDVIAVRELRTWYVAVPAACLEALRLVGLPGLEVPVLDLGQDRPLRLRFARIARRLKSAAETDLGPCMTVVAPNP